VRELAGEGSGGRAGVGVGAQQVQRGSADVYKRWVRFLNETPELRPLLDIEPSNGHWVGQHGEAARRPAADGRYYVPAESAQLFRNMLGRGLRARSGIVRGYFGVNNTMSQMKLGLSAFHAVGTAFRAVASDIGLALQRLSDGEPLRAILPALRAATLVGSPLDYILNGSAMLKEWRKAGASGHDDIAQLVGAMVRAGGRAGMESSIRTDHMTNMMRNIRRITAESGLAKANPIIRAAAQAPLAFWEGLAAPVMRYVVPRIKIGAFAAMAMRTLEKMGPTATEEEIDKQLQLDWASADNRMGQVVHENLFWNPMLRDGLQASMLSASWNYGTVSEWGGAAIDSAAQLKRIATGKRPEITNKMGYVLGALIGFGAIGGAIHFMFTRKKPQTLKDFYYPQTGEIGPDGQPVRMSMPTELKDVVGFATHPLETVRHKAAPLLATVDDIISNKDYRGVQVRRPGHFLEDSAKHFVKQMEPLSVSNFRRESDEGVPIGKRLASFAGFTQASSRISRTAAEDKAREIMDANRKSGALTQEEFAKIQVKQDVAEKLKANEKEGIKAMLAAIKDRILTPKEALDLRKRVKANAPPLLAAVEHSQFTTQQAMEVWALANEEERKMLRQVIFLKVMKDTHLSPTDKAAYRQQLIPPSTRPALQTAH
jgi:hypothetical protein